MTKHTVRIELDHSFMQEEKILEWLHNNVGEITHRNRSTASGQGWQFRHRVKAADLIGGSGRPWQWYEVLFDDEKFAALALLRWS